MSIVYSLRSGTVNKQNLKDDFDQQLYQVNKKIHYFIHGLITSKNAMVSESDSEE